MAAQQSIDRVMVATKRKKKTDTVVLNDQLPPLKHGEIRLSVDKAGLSTNNMFYAQMGDAPLLKFFAVYPIKGQKELANVPAWGLATVIESANPDFQVGERYRGFLHMSNVVQMKAKKTKDGFVAYGDGREKLVKAYNVFHKVNESPDSPFAGDGAKADLAMSSAPSALSGYVIYELLRMKDFYDGNSVVLTSASSKLSLATAVFLQKDKQQGRIKKVIAYTGSKNKSFIESTGLFDLVLTYDQTLPSDSDLKHVMIDVAGDATIFKKNKKVITKALAVGGTHSSAKSSTFTAFGPSGIVKMITGMAAPKAIANWFDDHLNPKLEMFFAPSVMADLTSSLGKQQFDKQCEDALGQFVDAAIDKGWIEVNRCEDTDAVRQAYSRIFRGEVPPSEAVIFSLAS
ncbi:MAG: DUF2855 family protein [Pseudomonadales bacterium]|nr:DUF2855 family protein [Pseudomonadales bacterium]